MKPPAMVKELKIFQDKVSYIRRFIPDLASITLAFMKLLKKEQRFKWGTLSKKLSKTPADYDKPPYNASPSSQKTVTLYLASSPSTIGALISQEDGAASL